MSNGDRTILALTMCFHGFFWNESKVYNFQKGQITRSQKTISYSVNACTN
jgi:hypothetical protein